MSGTEAATGSHAALELLRPLASYRPLPARVTEQEQTATKESPAAEWPWMVGATRKLVRLACLSAEELEGFSVPNERSVQSALLALFELAAVNTEPAIVAPSPEEGIAFEFLANDVCASIEFLNSGEVLAAVDFGEDTEPQVWDVTLLGLTESVRRLALALNDTE